MLSARFTEVTRLTFIMDRTALLKLAWPDTKTKHTTFANSV